MEFPSNSNSTEEVSNGFDVPIQIDSIVVATWQPLVALVFVYPPAIIGV